MRAGPLLYRPGARPGRPYGLSRSPEAQARAGSREAASRATTALPYTTGWPERSPQAGAGRRIAGASIALAGQGAGFHAWFPTGRVPGQRIEEGMPGAWCSLFRSIHQTSSWADDMRSSRSGPVRLRCHHRPPPTWTKGGAAGTWLDPATAIGVVGRAGPFGRDHRRPQRGLGRACVPNAGQSCGFFEPLEDLAADAHRTIPRSRCRPRRTDARRRGRGTRGAA